MTNKLIKIVENNLLRIIGDKENPTLLVAVSGGMDSMCLLDILVRLNYKVSIAHVNYNLRGEDSKMDKKLVEDFATEKELDCYCLNAFLKEILSQSPKNLQAEARRIRYEFFSTLVEAKKIDYVLTAHHLNDQLETFIFNIGRNAHFNELKGIAERRDNIIRPLINVPKSLIKEYSQNHKIPYREDLSNADTKYTRNKIRHEIVEPLQRNFPDYMRQFGNTIENIKQENLFLQQSLEKWTKKVVKTNNDRTRWDMSVLMNAPSPEYLFKHLIYQFGGNEKIAEQAFKAYKNRRTGSFFQLGDKRLLLNRNEFILADEELQTEQITNKYLDPEHPEISINAHSYISLKSIDRPSTLSAVPKSEAYFDQDKLNMPIYLRKIRKGDSIQAFGMQGRNKKIKKILTDAKIDRLDKQFVLVLTDANGQIIWVPGFAHSEIARIDSNTQKVYQLKVNRVKKNNFPTR